MTFLINTPDQERIDAFCAAFAKDFPDLQVVTVHDDYDPESIAQIFTWHALEDWHTLPNLEVVFSVSAGIDQFAALPSDIKLIRMVDPRNNQRVTEYVLAASLSCLRRFPHYSWLQRARNWSPSPAAFCSETTVGILGLGEIGQQAAKALSDLGFQVSGWSRTPKHLSFAKSYSGPDGLAAITQKADILVCLLPLTPETEGLLDQSFFAQMKPGASLIHVGRGAHCKFDALKEALDAGQVAQAFLDVFECEPLAADRSEWEMPNCVITPHIAGRIDPQTAVSNVVKNLRRHFRGEDLLWQVDRTLGY